jgi:hypothetical protein
MELTGGLLVDGTLRRDCAFRPVTGAVELSMAEAIDNDVRWQERVTGVLVAALARLGGQKPTWERVHGLSVGDRHYLVRRLAVHLDRDEVWLTAHCRVCGHPFDVFIEQSKLPVKPAGDGYPFATADTRVGRLHVRVPTGADQAALADVPPGEDAELALALRLIVEPRGVNPAAVDADAVRAIEAAVEDVAPEVGTRAELACPECENVNEIEIDPYLCLEGGAEELLAEIHLLASHYHWGEREILRMPRSRRQTYIRFIEKARGMTQ